MTRVSEQELAQAIRAVGDEVMTMTDIIAGEAVYSPELSYSGVSRGTAAFGMASSYMNVTGKLSDVPEAVRKKFQNRFKRSHKPSWGYYRRTRNGRREIAYANPYRLPSGAFAMLSLYDWRDSDGYVEFDLTAVDRTVESDKDRCDHDSILSPNASRDAEEIKAAVARWVDKYGREKYNKVAVWQNYWNALRIGDLVQNFAFECFSVESYSLGVEEIAKETVKTVCAALREAGMPFMLADSDWLDASSVPVEGNEPDEDTFKFLKRHTRTGEGNYR